MLAPGRLVKRNVICQRPPPGVAQACEYCRHLGLLLASERPDCQVVLVEALSRLDLACEFQVLVAEGPLQFPGESVQC